MVNEILNYDNFTNIKQIIYNSVELYKDNVAFTIKHIKGKETEYQNITYGEFLDDINKLGAGLFKLGVKEKRVAIIGRNRYEWVVSHLSALLGEMISVPLDKDLQYDELENSLIRSEAEYIIFDEKLLDEIKEIKKNNKTKIKEFICMSDVNDFKSVKDIINIGKKEEDCKRQFINTNIDNDKMSILLFTSGTTSQSKAVMLSQKNIASNVYALKCTQKLYPTDTNILFLPFHHIFGSTCIVWTLSYGLRHAFPDGLRYIKQNLCEYKVSVFVGVPILIESIYKAIMKEIDKQGKTKIIKVAMKISNFLMKFHIDIRRKLFKQVLDALGGKLRYVVSGGAPADKKIAKGFNDLGVHTIQGYGLTETAPVIAGEDEDHMRYGSVGIPMLNDTVEIVNKDDKGIGEIRVKGPNVMLGYYRMEELTNEVLKDGWFYTGDLGYIDKDGYLFITGRSKNMIVLKNGKKVFPEELEMVLSRIDLVEESMVFGMPDKNNQNNVTLSVKIVYNKDVAKEKYTGKTEEELRLIIWNQIKEINKRFPRYKHIQNMILSSEELIKTTTKKVKRQEEMKKILECK